MQVHRIARDLRAGPPRSARVDDVQRRVLLELVTSPPPQGDSIDELAVALHQPRDQIEAAVRALALCGLADRRSQTVRATPAAHRFDALWPIV